MTLLYAYLDESGIHDPSPIVAVAGFAMTKPDWTSFEVEWLEELNRFRCDGYPISAFHSLECEHGQGEFTGIAREIREWFPPRLAKIIAKYRPLSIWSAVARDDWEAVADSTLRSTYPHPFYFCFEHCAMEMASWSARYTAGSGIAVVYSEQDEFKDTIQTIWRAYKQAQSVAPEVTSFTTTSYRNCVPLQAADLLAFECFRLWEARGFTAADGRPLEENRRARELLSHGANDFGGMHTRETIERAARLLSDGTFRPRR